MQTPEYTLSKSRRTTGAILVTIPGVILIVSALTKLLQAPFVVAQMASLGFSGPRLMAIALLEIACAALYLTPRTRSFGLLMASAYLGGAVASHVAHGAVPAQPAIILGLAWVGTWLRHPQAFWSFSGDARPTSVEGSATSLRGA